MSRHGSHGGSQSQVRNVVSWIFSFFFALDLVVMAALLVVRVGVFSEKSFTALFDDDYVSYMQSYVNEKAIAYTYPTGIAPDVIDGVFTAEDIRRDVVAATLAAFHDNVYEPNLSEAEERLSDHVTTFLSDGGVEVSGETEEVVATYVDEIMDIYRRAIKLPGLDSIASVRAKYLNYGTMGLIVCVALAIVLLVTLLRLHHFVHRSLRYVAYGTGGAALMCLLGPTALYQSGAYLGLKLKPQYFYHFGVTLAARVLRLSILSGIVLVVVTCVVIAVVAHLRSQLIRRGSGRHHD